MDRGTSVSLRTDPNGSVTVSNADSVVTIMPDGTVVVSTTAPLQLAGAALAKLDRARLPSEEHARLLAALAAPLRKG